MSRLLLPGDQDINIADAIGGNPDMAQIHLWRAQALRDRGQISDCEMAKVEGVTAGGAKRARLLWNPYTGEFRTVEIAERYRCGDFYHED
jgi:hypothetical protein